MLICGIKLTHDASVAVIEAGRLSFCVEVEKIDNNARYSEMGRLERVAAILDSQSLALRDVDRFVVDGWHGSGQHWRGDPLLPVSHGGRDGQLRVASYNETRLQDSILERSFFPGALLIDSSRYDYASYMHVAGHVLGTYCASPFAGRGEAAYVLVWDGGQYPRLYLVDPQTRTIVNKGHLFCLLGTIYAIIGHYFGPYQRSPEQLEIDRQRQDLEGYFGGYSIAGKLMSYIALGKVVPELLRELPGLYKKELEVDNTFEHKFARAVKNHVAGRGYSDADVLHTHHAFLEQLLLEGLKSKLQREQHPAGNLCFTGGSALNIKWNSSLRSSGLFASVWVPPFPNDSGSAIGAACCEMVTQEGRTALDWNVYSGPQLRRSVGSPQWQQRPYDLDQLARLLADEGEPVVFLQGAAELGPRALGNRSILAPAVSPGMKEHLNQIKKREQFRPVAPICMQEHAASLFDPGTPDPYMLFDHRVRPDWATRIPAICHLDGTARLQTLNRTENPSVYGLLEAYYRLTGIPVLTNTSANLNGSGFFPDVDSALRWGGTRYVYCDGTLYTRLGSDVR